MSTATLNNPKQQRIEKSSEKRIPDAFLSEADQQIFDNKLPEGAAVNAEGVPTYMNLTGDSLIWAITATATCGFTLFGYDQGVMAGLITGPQFIETFPACDVAVQGASRASLLQATYVAIYEVGCLAGAIFALWYGDKFGRRRMAQIGAYIMLFGVLIQVTAFKGHMAGAQFLIGRVITGVGNGMNTATLPTWHAETAKSHNRGLLVCIEASMIATGTAIAYWVDFGFSFIPSSVNWRVPIALQSLFAFGLLYGIHYMPESPRWLISKGELAEGQRVIAALEPASFDDPRVITQTRLILESLEGASAIRKRDLLTGGPTQHLRRVWIGASSQIMQQIGGANAVIYFAPVIFEQNLGLGRQLALILGGVNVTVYALAAFASYPLVERMGRRKLFLIGSVGQAVSMFIIMGCLIPGSPEIEKGAVFGLFLYLIFFGFTWLELPWLYPAEINPLRTRTNANAISTMCNWSFNFAVVEITPPLLTAINWGTFLLFGVINVCFIPIIWVFYPETAGRTLEEIDIIFATGFRENRSYVEVAKNMPSLSAEQVEERAKELGLNGDEEAATGEPSTSSSVNGST